MVLVFLLGRGLPYWTVTTFTLPGTPETMQKANFPPDNKHKLRPDCMVMEFPRDRPPNKRTREGAFKAPPLLNGKPRKVWIIELGYCSDTRYLEKLAEKQQQHEQLCKLLTIEGYDVQLLPVILSSAGMLSNVLNVWHVRCRSPMPERKNCPASFTSTAYTPCKI